MTIHEAIRVLELHNKWRRGAETEMQSPEQVGIAIDVVVSQKDLSIKFGDIVYCVDVFFSKVPLRVVGIRGDKEKITHVEVKGEIIGFSGEEQKMWVLKERIVLKE